MNSSIKKILVVDDDNSVIRAFLRIMKKEKYTVETALDGQTAKEKVTASAVRGKPFDVIVSDIIMPRMSGIELSAWINRYHPEISLLLVSGFGANYKVLDTIRPEMDDFCQKPFSFNKIKDKLEELGAKRSRFVNSNEEELR